MEDRVSDADAHGEGVHCGCREPGERRKQWGGISSFGVQQKRGARYSAGRKRGDASTRGKRPG